MTRTYLRYLAAISLAVAIEHLRVELLLPWPEAGHGGIAFAQPMVGTPAMSDPTNSNGAGFSSNNVGVTGLGSQTPMLMNNFGPSGPSQPTDASRPSSWPGGPDDPNRPRRTPGIAPRFPAQRNDLPGAAPENVEAPKRNLAEPPYDPAEIVARVGSESIQANELLPTVNQYVSKLMAQNADQLAQLPPAMREVQINRLRRQVMERSVKDTVNMKLVLSELKLKIPAEGLKKTEKHIRTYFNETYVPKKLMVDYGATSITDLENKLREAGSSLDVQRTAFVEQQIVVSFMQQQVKEDKDATHEQMLAFYRDHIADWETPARAKWEQLTVSYDKFATKEAAAQALARWGNDIFVRGAKFADVAKAHSQEFAAEEGGFHDWTSQASLKSAVLDHAVFALPVGAMSPILEDEDAYHIVRVIEREDLKVTPFSEVQPEIKKRMHDGGMNRQRNEFVNQLRARTPVWTVFDDSPSEATAQATSPTKR